MVSRSTSRKEITRTAPNFGLNVEIGSIASHEQGFVASFVQKDRQDRLVFELQKHRGRFLGRFCHTALDYLDPRFVIRLDPPNSDSSAILRLLTAKGAGPKCYAISMNAFIDGRILLLSEALEAAIGFGLPTILSCRPGKLAYIETEQVTGPPERFLLVCLMGGNQRVQTGA